MSEKITAFIEELKAFLLEKNRRYGNSALEPNRVFSDLAPNYAIRVRIDDKLSRISNSKELRKNDVVDLIGYLVLLCVSEEWTSLKDLID